MRFALVLAAPVLALVVLLEVLRPLPERPSLAAVGAGLAPSSPELRRLVGTWEAVERGEPGRWRELRNAAGEVVVLAERPARIVSQTLASDEVVVALCPPERIAALGVWSVDPAYSNCVAEARAIGRFVKGSAERILALRPDLVFVASYSSVELVRQLQVAGAPVVQFTRFDSLRSIEDTIRTIGFCVGESAGADRLVAEMRRRIAAAVARIPDGAKPPRVLSYNGGVAQAAGTVFDDVLLRIGAINIPAATGRSGFVHISSEQVAKWDPDFIVVGFGPGQGEAARAEVLQSPAIAAARAGRPERVIVVPSALFGCVSHHVAGLAEVLVERLYGLEARGR